MIEVNNLKIALVQTDIIWENISANLSAYSNKMKDLSEDIDLIILPEMFATGFTINVEKVKQFMGGNVFLWMKNLAISKHVAVFGSVIIEENNKYYNRALFFYPDGKFEFYDKKHLFSLAKEDEVFSAGNERKIIEYKGWRIMPQVCYDLRFPVWSRNDLDYDLLIYIASWPTKRRHVWQTLLKARAIENMSYVAGVNRIGEDGNGYKYSGNSNVINALGIELSNSTENKEEIITVELDKKTLNNTRKHFAFLDDMDDFEIH